MPPVNGTPRGLKPYIAHGVDLSWSNGDSQSFGQCPFCMKEKKFSVEITSGKARCFVCGNGNAKGGLNPLTFIREIHDASDKATTDYSDLAEDRSLLFPETLMVWGAARSVTTGEWLVPAHSPDGRLHQLYRYVRVEGKMRLLPTPGVHEDGKAHGLHGAHLFDAGKGRVFVCEGPWDAMALWEMLRQCKLDEEEGRLVFSGEASSLLADANVVACPGSNVWQDGWSSMMAGKDVVLLFDSDHPNAKAKNSPCAGHEGMRRVCDRLASCGQPPNSIRYLPWGKDGYDPSLKSGYDVRDLLSSSGDTLDARMPALKGMLDRLAVIPDGWVKGRSLAASKNGKVEVTTVSCSSWKALVNAWRRAMKWTPDLEYGLAACLAASSSVDIPGDQLWIKIISPPSTGKTTIVEGLAVCKEYTLSKDTLTGLSSGYQPDSEGKEDFSLIPQMKGKTFIVKDADTVLQNPALTQILSQFRALYDRNFRSSFKNKMSRDYVEIDVVVIVCGTNKSRKFDETELGERFLDIELMKTIDPGHEKDICDRVMSRLCDFEEDSGEDHAELMSTAKRMTGGYVAYLRQNARELWKNVEVDSEVRETLRDLAIFVAHMRARPGQASAAKHAESSSREMAPRLVGQIVKMAKCLAIVHGRDSVDEHVLHLVRRCAFDTASGATLEMSGSMFRAGREAGCSVGSLAGDIKQTEDRARGLLRFMSAIGVAEQHEFKPLLTNGTKGAVQRRWRLTQRMHGLYGEVVGNA